MQAAEVVAGSRRLQELASRVPGKGPFEALYEVQGVDGINVDARLLQANVAAPRPVLPLACVM